MTDNRTNEPTEAQIERATVAAANVQRARHRLTPITEMGDDTASQHLREQITAALVAAGVAPQGPRQNETKSGQDFVSFDAEKVAEVLRRDDWTDELWDDLSQQARDCNWDLYMSASRALCEAAKRGELSR